MGFAVLANHRVQLKESEKRDKYQDLTREPKTMEIRVTVIPVVASALGIIPKGLVKGTRRLRNQRTSKDHPDYCIIKIDLSTEKSPGNLRRFGETIS